MPATSMNGTTIGTSAALPATYNAAGYGALTFTNIGEVLDIGELAKTYNLITHQTLGRNYPEKIKGTFDIPNVTLTLGKIAADGGQAALQTALAAAASYAFVISLPSGNSGSFTGKVVKAGQGAVAVDGVETTVVDIAIDPKSLFEA